MNKIQQFALILGVGTLFLNLLGRLTLRWSAHYKIQQAFKQRGTSVIRIRIAGGFLDLGSVWEAATNTGYVATIMAPDGRESDRFCLVRYIPIVGFSRSVEIWSSKSTGA